MPSSSPAQTGIVASPPGHPTPYVEAWQKVLHLGEGLDDARLIAEYGCLSGLTSDRIPIARTMAVEAYAEVRLEGSSEELKVRVEQPTLDHIRTRFADAYSRLHGSVPQEAAIEIVTIRVRRFG
jgi:hypothetical protein